MLVHQPSPNWLTANSPAYLHHLLEVLAPANCQIRVGGCPWCLHETAGWMHTLRDCMGFWELAPLEARYWLALLWTRGIGYGLVGSSTWILGLVELAAS